MKRIVSAALLLALLASGCTRAPQKAPANTDAYRNYYEIFVGGFYDLDGNGVGDLQGVTDRLPYLSGGKNALGVDGIWLMPVMPSPTYHKYDVTDYCAIDPAYGTLDDFGALAQACADRGVALIIDLVLNHTSSKHPWFVSAAASLGIPDCGQDACQHEELCTRHNPYCGYYRFSNAPELLPNHYRLANGWQYEGVFWNQMPDLNLDNEDLRREILEITQFWLDRGVSGFRLDAVGEFYSGNVAKNVEFLTWLNTEVKKQKPDSYLVGEAWTDAGSIARYYESGVDSFFNFPYSQQNGEPVKAVRGGNGAGFASKVAEWNARLNEVSPTAVDAPFLSNHDQGRSAGFLMNNLAHQKMCAALYLFMPGAPFIYYGEEIGMTGSGRDENKRQPMVWSVNDTTGRPYPPSGTEQTQSLEAGFLEQLKDENSLLRFYINALALKNRHPEIARGALTAIDTGTAALAALRYDYNGARVYVVHNVSGKPVVFPTAGSELHGAKLQSSLSAGGEKITQKSGEITLPPYSTGVWR